MFNFNLEGEEVKVAQMEDWKGSFDEDFQPGAYVDADIAWDLINALPPHIFDFGYFQCGEPHSHRADKEGNFRPTYLTFIRVSREPEIWRYCGDRFSRGL